MAAFFFVGMVPPNAVNAASTDREQALENRVDYLEKRLAEVEALLKSQAAGATKPRATARATSPRARAAPTPQMQPAAKDVASAAAKVPPPAAQPAETPSASLAAAVKEAPQELNVLRQNSVTLNPSGLEVSTDLEYVTRHTDLQRDRGFLSNTSVRYGLLKWLELSLTVPAGYTDRTTNVGLNREISDTVSGLGDLLLQANARVVEQTADWPGVVVSLGTYLPTGQSPYNFNHYSFNAPGAAPTPNPANIFSYYFSQGGWGLRTNLQFYKTVDPLILFFGFGMDYFFPQQFSGYTVTTGLRYNYNLGFSFAVSEKLTLGFTLNGEYLQDFEVDGRKVFESGGEPTTARLSLIERIAKNTYLEPSATFGLNRDAPDFALGLGLRKRF